MLIKVAVATVLAIAAAGALLLTQRTAPAPVTSTPTATAPVHVTAGLIPYRGMAIQIASGWYKPRETYVPLLREIADLGANSVLISIPAHMEHATSQSVYLDLRKIPPPEDFKYILRQAHDLGLRTFVMPIVLLRNPRGSEWRGVIDPPDWEDWWNQYNDFILYFADVCREGGADALMVGSELVSAEKYTNKWYDLIAQCRTRFSGGQLGYSANWDHYRPVEFWDKLDFVGMTSYYTLADAKNPTIEEIIAKWEPIRKDLLDWQKKIGKPLLLTEVGWCSQEGAGTAPWNYYQNQVATPEGLEEQRRLYEAFVRVWGDTPQLAGVFWWEWDTSPGGPTDFGYSPKAKPAERVLREFFETARTPAPSSTPSSNPTTAPTGAPTPTAPASAPTAP